MQPRQVRLPHPILRIVSAALACALYSLGLENGGGQSAPRITATAVAGGKISLNWTGSSFSYDVQSTAILAMPNWGPGVNTVRTNILVPVAATSAFFRVVAAPTNQPAILFTATNLVTGEVLATTLLAPTNADLWYLGPTNWGFTEAVARAADRQQYDIAFDESGGYSFLDLNGAPIGTGGWISAYPGTGTNQFAYLGIMTNQGTVFAFSAVAASSNSAAQIRPKDLTPGNPWNGFAPQILPVWMLSTNQCQDIIALQSLECAASCPAQATACALNIFNPQSSYCYPVVHLSWETNAWGNLVFSACNVECIKGCCGPSNPHQGCQ